MTNLKVLIEAMLAVAFSALVAKAEDPGNRPPTAANVSYGPHERNVLDFWQAPGTGPRPLLIMIHGGGWTAGDKDQFPSQARTYLKERPEAASVNVYLDRGISCASINYRFAPQDPLPAPVLDVARALQFLRSRADIWNLRKDRVVLAGVSAGAATAMWLALHDDLADREAADPVLRESTRVSAAISFVGQTSIDPKTLSAWLGPNVLLHRMTYMAVGEQSIDDALRDYGDHKSTYFEYSAINHVSADDPPLMLVYDADASLPARNASHGIHHPQQGVKLKEKSDSLRHECHLIIPQSTKSPRYADPFELAISTLLGP